MTTHHTIDYIEFTVRDLAESKRFYAAAFGWAFNDCGPGYSGIQRSGGEGEIGGLTQGEVAAPSAGAPLVVLGSSALEASLAAVEGAGGTIVEPIFGFPGGRRFHFADPSGNVLGVWQPSAPSPG